MASNGELRDYVDEYASLTLEADGIKRRLEWLKGQFEQMALARLKDTKLQTAEFWGTSNNRVAVTTSATVKPISLTMVKQLLGPIAGDFIKEKTTDDLTEPCKRLLSTVVQGEYLVNGSLEDILAGISDDPKVLAALRKKLKGKYEKDMSTLVAVAGLDTDTASDAAYLIAEAVNWERLTQVLRAAEWTGTTQAAIDIIKAAIIVEDGIKVTVAAEPPTA